MVLQDKALFGACDIGGAFNFCNFNYHCRSGNFRSIHEAIQRIREADINKILLGVELFVIGGVCVHCILCVLRIVQAEVR